MILQQAANSNINLYDVDKNISVGCKPEDIEMDLNEIASWLLANKLSLKLPNQMVP